MREGYDENDEDKIVIIIIIIIKIIIIIIIWPRRCEMDHLMLIIENLWGTLHRRIVQYLRIACDGVFILYCLSYYIFILYCILYCIVFYIMHHNYLRR